MQTNPCGIANMEKDHSFTSLSLSSDQYQENDSSSADEGYLKPSLIPSAFLGSAQSWGTRFSINAILIWTVYAILFTTLISVGSWITFHIRQPEDKMVSISPCGSTAQEARERGCHFDVISFCWLPDQCYDPHLSSAFDNLKSWEWYLDPNKTQPLTHEQVMTGEFTGLYVNWEYHLRHCTAMWKKLHRAILGDGKKAIDSYIGPYDHTKHCEHMLLNDREVGFEEINTIILVKFPDCGIA